MPSAIRSGECLADKVGMLHIEAAERRGRLATVADEQDARAGLPPPPLPSPARPRAAEAQQGTAQPTRPAPRGGCGIVPVAFQPSASPAAPQRQQQQQQLGRGAGVAPAPAAPRPRGGPPPGGPPSRGGRGGTPGVLHCTVPPAAAPPAPRGRGKGVRPASPPPAAAARPPAGPTAEAPPSPPCRAAAPQSPPRAAEPPQPPAASGPPPSPPRSAAETAEPSILPQQPLAAGTKVWVKTLYGRTVAVPCTAEDTVMQVKRGVEQLEGIPVWQQRLLFRLEEIRDDDAVLSELGVVPCMPPYTRGGEWEAEEGPWRRARGGIFEPSGEQILHVVLRPASAGPAAQRPSPAEAARRQAAAAEKQRLERDLERIDNAELAAELEEEIANARAEGLPTGRLERRLARVRQNIELGALEAEVDATGELGLSGEALAEALSWAEMSEFGGSRYADSSLVRLQRHSGTAPADGGQPVYEAGRAIADDSDSDEDLMKAPRRIRRGLGAGDDPYFHKDGRSYRLNNVGVKEWRLNNLDKKKVDLDRDRNTSTLSPDQGQGVVLGRSALRPWDERMDWDRDVPVNTKMQLLARRCMWVPGATLRVVTYDNPSFTVQELARLCGYISVDAVEENCYRIPQPGPPRFAPPLPELGPAAAVVELDDGASATVASTAATRRRKPKVQGGSFQPPDSQPLLRAWGRDKAAQPTAAVYAGPTPVNAVELQPGVVLMRGMMDIRTQQWIVDESFRLGTNRDGVSGGFFRVLETGLTELNQGHRGQFGEDLRCFAPHMTDVAHHYLRHALNHAEAAQNLPQSRAHWCNFNMYGSRSPGILWHRDGDETKARVKAGRGRPVISFSLGLSCEFRFKNDQGEDDKVVRLDSGDVLIFGGPSRNMLHCVTRIYPGTTPKMLHWPYPEGRLNLTFRHRN
eukprot:TRINITY_DN14559_c0_g1_i1.p1 TRINITY_DN14559_c0_g1~~TRINITY_DN14559_c0_g1_i1.p1  ORF type:complete len:916 (+),score=266.44 TRINITY_DN14559_c0_g1_i1:102-2849(+)